ncbi:MAG: coproporphyrinogen dehydrogenase HemZ [Clostridia bacterium]|nr:coproporphyrinogen dehydrogenase HemZ [Clostridia bacterium]
MNEQIRQDLASIGPDLTNITRLFGLPDPDWDKGGPFSYGMEEVDGKLCCVFCHDAEKAERSAPLPPATGDERVDALHRRRTCRRLCRQTLYDLCRALTDQHPAWGSLTGIRPTRLIWEQLEAGKSLEEAEATLIRDFDVTPDKASLLRETVAVQQTLPLPGDQWADVYIGIPFCTTRCAYCSFSSGELGNGKLVEPYLQALFRDMENASALLRETGRSLRALYVGGGTPTSLNEEQLHRFLDKVMTMFPEAVEYTVEAGRPDTITPGKLRAILGSGVGRISINPQTMNDRTLQVIGRAHTAQQTIEAYAMAREAGVPHINMDVIAGLPGETEVDFTRTMEAAKALHPESLTVHALAIKRSTRLHLENAPLPDPAAAAAMTAMGRETAAAMGLQPYYLYRQKNMAGGQENVGYALPGHACLYNVDIMEENTHIIACGAGGISKRIYPDEGHIGRAPNVSNIEYYIERVDEMMTRRRKIFEDGAT